MTVFIDASAIVAIFANEADGGSLAARIEAATQRITSPMAIWEAHRALVRITRTPSNEVERQLHEILVKLDVDVVGIGSLEGHEAIKAHARFGKGNHPAELNMGDCFAYACANTNNAGLLYKGNDFARTYLA